MSDYRHWEKARFFLLSVFSGSDVYDLEPMDNFKELVAVESSKGKGPILQPIDRMFDFDDSEDEDEDEALEDVIRISQSTDNDHNNATLSYNEIFDLARKHCN